MDDIAAELRQDYANDWKENVPYEVIDKYEKERHRAADEIERLREERDKLKKALRSLIALTETALKEGE